MKSVCVLRAFAFSALTLTGSLIFGADLPPPNPKHHASKMSHVVGWPSNKTPMAPQGFTVLRWADQFQNPRWIYVGPNGDIFVAEAKTKEKNGGNKIVFFCG